MYKKVLKKVLSIFILILFLSSTPKVSAKTLGDLKNELEKAKEEYQKTKDEKRETENQMTNVSSNIKKAQKDIEKANEDIVLLSNQIDELNKNIKEKTKEVKKIINFEQVSNNENAYLEYIFGADDFTDMIYRTAVSEQLSNYNDNLIKNYNKQISDNKKKQEDLKKKQEDLKAKQKRLEQEYSSLGSKLEDIVDIKVDEEEAIKVQEEIIKMYIGKECKDNEDITTCGRKTLPPDTNFWRPLESGRISSNFGYRNFNGGEYHTGVDIAKTGGTPVYATANGTVAALTIKYRCGGNMVFIHHRVNGKYYTSLYMHLRSINVTKGQTVTKNTVIGYVGGDSSTPWDHCSTGAHTHFTMLTGLVGTDYRAWSSAFYSHLVNPRNYVNFPALGKSYSNRYEAF